MLNYVFYDVDPSTIITGVDGFPVTPISASAFVQNNSDYQLISTDPSCNCAPVETWLTYSGLNPSPSITVGLNIIVGVVYGPVPPYVPKKP